MPVRKPTGGTKGKTPAKKTPAKQRPGIGGGKRGQRLAQGAADYVSPNIATAPGYEGLAKGALYGAYDSGSTLDQIKRNEYLNTLSLPDRERAMSQMGYWTGGVPTATPLSTKREVRQYAKRSGATAPGTYLVPSGTMGVNKGQFEIGADGKLVKGSAQAYRPAKGKVVGPEKGAAKAGGKGARSAKLTSGAKKKSSPGGRKVTAAERKRIQAAKAKQRGRGKGKGGGGGGAGEESAEPLAAPYAEADTTTTSMLRSHGKAYASAREGYGNSRRGQESAGETGAEETEESKRQRRRNRRKKTVKKNKRGNYVTRVRKGGKVVSKRTTKRKPGSKK